MKVTNRKIVEVSRDIESIEDIDLPMSTKLSIARRIRWITNESKLIMAYRDRLIVKHGEKVEVDGKPSYSLSADSKEMPKYQKEEMELLNAEVECPYDSEVVDCNGLKMANLVPLVGMEPFITIVS